jgi:outer membrane lipoprotein carrier protein
MRAALIALLLASPDPAGVARKVQAHYEHTGDLQARFVQTYTHAAFGRKQVSKGMLRVKKPGKMRWDYEEPIRKSIAVSGSRLVQWEPEANQAWVDESFDARAMSAAVTFLLGKGSLAKEFDLALDAAGRLLCTPKKPDPRVAALLLEVGPGGEVLATEVRDAQGNSNEIRLSEVRRNAGLPDAAFEVKIPEGARRLPAPGR